MEIVLGTVQFGLDYGVTNDSGKPSFKEVDQILAVAKSKGIYQIDTAPSYGNAEERLGTLNVSDFSIYTKTPHFKNDIISLEDTNQLIETFNNSLQHLNVQKVKGLLLHNVADCYKENSQLLFIELERLKQQKRVNKIGISVYEPKDIEWFLKTEVPIDIIQLPLNVLDQRMLQSGLLQKLKDKQIEVHVRSIFLQGILLGDKSSIPKDKYNYVLEYFEDLNKNNLTKLEAALLFIKQIKEIDNVLLGVNSLTHLQEIIRAVEKIKTWNEQIDFSKYACNNLSVIDPRRW